MSSDAQPLLRRQNLWPLALVNLGVITHGMVWYLATTAMPTAVGELDAAAFISWSTSVYLVTSILGGTLMTPLKARFGARRTMMCGGLVVTAGSLLAALSPDILLLLCGRALQGLGEGVLMALSYALVRELFHISLVSRVFSVQAISWAFSLTLGPLLGGWLTEAWSWRMAFVGAALVPLPMLALGLGLLRDPARHDAVRHPAPLVRILLLALGVMAIAAADRLGHAAAGAASVLVGLALIALVLRIDRRHAPHLFPTAFPGLRHPASLGLWVLLLMPLAQAPVYVYIPYLMQMHRGLSPVQAGYFGVVHALAWVLVAGLVVPLLARWQNAAIVIGPAMLALGLAGVALTLSGQPLFWVAASLLVVGAGMGLSNAYLNQRVMASVDRGQEDATSAAIPTLSGLGAAVSAAWAGLVGNAVGLDQPLNVDVVSRAAWVLYGTGAVLALLAHAMAWRLRQRVQRAVAAR